MSDTPSGYTTRDVASVLDVSESRVRSWARDGLLQPARAGDGTYRFTFPDIILLRTAQALESNGVPARRIHAALSHLREQLPSGRPLSAVHIRAEGDRILVQDRDTLWEPVSEQTSIDLAVDALAEKVAPLARAANRARVDRDDLGADDWFDLAVDLEAVSLEEADLAYGRVLDLDPDHPEALLNRGRLLHESGDLHAAEIAYRRSIQARPANALGYFNLGVVLEDVGRATDAAEAYRTALELDPALAEVHFNLARLLESMGEVREAFRHLSTYRRLKEHGIVDRG